MIGTEVSFSTPTRLRGRPPPISNTLLDSNFPSLFNSTSASTFIFHHVRAAIVFSDLAPFTSSSSILNKNGATFTHLSASPSHTPSYIRTRIANSNEFAVGSLHFNPHIRCKKEEINRRLEEITTYLPARGLVLNGVDVARNPENPHFPE
ncbi:unnamed protein product [Vicia faba]|uniref:Uncharacterized protein n=1 Tax=Vicia faba TaxID=3906 RepID=A0AAV1AZX1_VICFA|nr:unnamed protein product [Vicia faba]